jgi:hypothetical protein
MALNPKFTSSDIGGRLLPALVVFAALVAVAGLLSVRLPAPAADPFGPVVPSGS